MFELLGYPKPNFFFLVIPVFIILLHFCTNQEKFLVCLVKNIGLEGEKHFKAGPW